MMSVTRYDPVQLITKANNTSKPRGLKKVASIRATVSGRIAFCIGFVRVTTVHVGDIFRAPNRDLRYNYRYIFSPGLHLVNC